MQHCCFFALKMEEGAVIQEMWAAPSRWKRRGNDSPLETPAGNAALPTA